MGAPAQNQKRSDLRDHLAAERTLLAWVRTGSALMYRYASYHHASYNQQY
jgi:uncharacterized membrane protein YidH (DUF202 family)